MTDSLILLATLSVVLLISSYLGLWGIAAASGAVLAICALLLRGSRAPTAKDSRR